MRTKDLPSTMYDPGFTRDGVPVSRNDANRRVLEDGGRLCDASPRTLDAFLDANPDLTPRAAWNTVWIEGCVFYTLELQAA